MDYKNLENVTHKIPLNKKSRNINDIISYRPISFTCFYQKFSNELYISESNVQYWNSIVVLNMVLDIIALQFTVVLQNYL